MTIRAAERHQTEAQSFIRTFIRVDLLGVLMGIVFVVLANAIFVRDRDIWLIMPFLAFTSTALWLSGRRADRSEIFSALALIAIGNWVVAIAVAIMFPFLWPVMVLTVLMPLILATPFLEPSQLVPATASTAFVAGSLAIAGLFNDDGGVIPDIADELELFIVAGGLAAHMVPIALIVWQHNQPQRGALDRTTALNSALVASEAHLLASRWPVVRRPTKSAVASSAIYTTEPSSGWSHCGSSFNNWRIEWTRMPNFVGWPTRPSRTWARQSKSCASLPTGSIRRSWRPADSRLRWGPLPAALRLVVTDDGPGFNADATRLSSGGLMNMADRIGAVQGTLDLQSLPGGGTTVTATIPVG